MKKHCAVFMIIFCLALCACGQSSPTWQEQYDLGVRYLSEGNYEEAIIAFTAAIEIDSKRAPAYVGRGDAYVGSGELEETLTLAQADYETAIELDGTVPEAYLGLAEVYIRRGDCEMAEKILRDGLEAIGEDSKLVSKLSEVEALIEESRIFTENAPKPEDFKIAGRPFWELSLEDVQAQYSNVLTTLNNLSTYGVRRTYTGSAAKYYHEGNMHWSESNRVEAEQVSGDSGISSFYVRVQRKDVEVPLDIRGIRMWDSCADVLTKLGLRDSWIEEFLALGPGEDIGFSNKDQKWMAQETEYAEDSGTIRREIWFSWSGFSCQSVDQANDFSAYLYFDENDQLIEISLSLYYLDWLESR